MPDAALHNISSRNLIMQKRKGGDGLAKSGSGLAGARLSQKKHVVFRLELVSNFTV